jgi:hypothetical protein
VRHGRTDPFIDRPNHKRRRWLTAAVALVTLGAAAAIGLPIAMSANHRPFTDADAKSPATRQAEKTAKPADAGTLSAATSSPSPSSASHSTESATASSASAASANPACGRAYTYRSESWPNCSNTGAPAGSSLTHRSGDLKITKSGTVLNHVDLTGSLDIYANNVTVENSVIDSSNWWGIFQRAGYHGLRVLHDTITGVVGKGPDSGGEDFGVWSLGGRVAIGHSNISEFGGDVDILRGFVYDSYIHSAQAFGSEGISGCDPLPNPIPYRCYNHGNAFGIDTGHYITLQHNTILMPRIPGADSALELDDDLGTISHVTVTDNYIAGGGYCTYAASSPSLAPSTYIVYTKNAFSTLYYGKCAFYGPVAFWSSKGKGNKWSGNYWASGPRKGKLIP